MSFILTLYKGERHYMHYVKFISLVFLLLLLSACGRQLPDETATPEPSISEVDDTTDTTDDTPDEQTQDDDEQVSQETTDGIIIPDDPLIAMVADADPENGQSLFETLYGEVGFACNTCHSTGDNMMVGPGLNNIALTSLQRVSDQAPHRYIYNSIINPNDYVVDGFNENLMPQTYADLFSEEELVDLVAYLMTLSDEPLQFVVGEVPDVVQEDGTEEPQDVVEETEVPEATDDVTVEVTDDAPEMEETDEAPDDDMMVEETEEPDDAVVEATEEPAEMDEPSLPFELPEAVVVYGDLSEDRIIRLVAIGIPENGAMIFDVNCAGCHFNDSLETLEGPGLGGIPAAIAESGSDYPAEVFFYNGIADPAFHPEPEEGFLTTLEASEVFDLIAYMMTLEDGGDGGAEMDGDMPEIVTLVAQADVANGDTLFNMGNLEIGAVACSTCHLPNSSEMLVGPGMLNIGEIAATRIEGMVAETYLYESIVNPNAYLVEGYAGGMLANYGDLYSDEEIYDIIAYLLTLTD